MKTDEVLMEQRASFPSDFSTLLSALAQPAAFPWALTSSEPIEVIQTHASAALRVAQRVYKLKKPKNLGSLTSPRQPCGVNSVGKRCW